MIDILLYQILPNNKHGKTQKSRTKAINLKHQLQRGMINLSYLMDHYSMSDIRDYFECIIRKHEIVTVKNPPIRIYKRKIELELHLKLQ